jgi:hypothetical protein
LLIWSPDFLTPEYYQRIARTLEDRSAPFAGDSPLEEVGFETSVPCKRVTGVDITH